mgnify:CR=1 FL=1
MIHHGMYFSFASFEGLGFVDHGFSTRRGGVGTGVYESLNLGERRGDDPAAVAENTRRIGEALGFDPARVAHAHQIHSTKILHVTEATDPVNVPEADGLITNVPGLTLRTSHADCVPLFVADPQTRSIGLAHAGWRGTVDGMAQSLVEAMVAAFGCKPQSLRAGIGPSIGPCCYQVGPEVAEAFLRWPFGGAYIRPDAVPGKFIADLWGFNRALFLECGLRPRRIETAQICTHCHPELFFSHRYQGLPRGTMMAYLTIRE